MVVPSVSAERTLTSLYEAIHRRRDVRGQFTGAPIDPEPWLRNHGLNP